MSDAVIETRGLEKRYGSILAVSGLNLKVERGEIFGLVGADGAGKTTTIQMLCTLSVPSAGEAYILGMGTIKQADRIKEKIGYMSERFNLYPTLTVDENLEFFARLRNIPRDVSEPRKRELLSFCRLEPFRQRQAEHLSGGMQKKLALACSLIHEPDVIFLDEPTTGVDPVSRRDFWKIVTRFLSRGITVLVSTPYLDEAERFNRVAFMHRGQIIACDNPRNLKAALSGEVLEIKAHPADRAVAVLKRFNSSSRPQVFGDTIHIMVDEAGKRSLEIRRLFDSENVSIENIEPISASLEDAFVARLTEIEEPQSSPAVHAGPAGISTNVRNLGETAISVSDLTRKFGAFTAVDHVSFEVKRGEIFGLLGPNGSGKTTTIRMIIGLLEPTSGKAWVLGQNLATAGDLPRSKMGYMSQKFSLYPDLTVEQNINLYGGLYGLSPSELQARKNWVLGMAGLKDKEKRRPPELSGGWKRRLALGCAIIHRPEVVFLDEPTAGVDPLSRRSFWELIQELVSRGTTVFVTTHYMDEAEHCDRVGIFYHGKLVALDTPRRLKTGQIKGELAEVVVLDYARALELLLADPRYRQVNLFGSALHVTVDNVEAASPEIKKLLEGGQVSVRSIRRVPFDMEDVFIALVEEHGE